MRASWIKRADGGAQAASPPGAPEPEEGPAAGRPAAPGEPAGTVGAPSVPGEDAPETPGPLGPVANIGVGIAVVALGAAGIAGSLALGAGAPARPAAGTWPLLVSCAMAGLGVVLLLMAGRTRDTEAFSAASWKVLAGLATMAGFVAVIGVIGFEIPSALLAFVWLRFLGGESWRLSAVTSVLIVVAFYVIFVGLLAVPIPHLF
ncbi:tripartite tricarboxylate transporter TctB family protein [Nocardiopsis sediminis]|uniref:Tripartite tricarboxylate transporter TctB family protein n=1 Tax=Nocardiopsis sediminis TaxID=1778267 RepID=A0ABV8FKI3_9ACTN